MARQNRAQASSLFLMELILAILFFSVASAVCVRFFVKSHLLSTDSQELNAAVYEISGIAEVLGNSDSAEEVISLLAGQYPLAVKTDASFTVYYDADFQPCEEEAGVYAVLSSFSEEGAMLTADMQAIQLSDQSVIYALRVTHHVQQALLQAGD